MNLTPSSDTTTAYTISNNRYTQGESPTENLHNSFRVIDKNNIIVGEFCVENMTNGSNQILLNVRNTDSNGAQVYSSIYFDINKDGTERNFYPSASNLTNLGTSSRKWKDVNTTLLNGKTPAYASDLNSKANDYDVVHKTGGNEYIAGVKAFSFISDSLGADGLSYGHHGDVDDAISEQKANLTLSSWNNIGMWSSYKGRYTIGFDVRRGNITANAIKSGPNKIDCGVEEQGDGYIRYSNGIQICWGSISWTSSCSKQWGSLYETSIWKNASYAKSFTELPSVSAYGGIGGKGVMLEYTEGTSATTPVFYLTRGVAIAEEMNCFVRYIAIGKWK